MQHVTTWVKQGSGIEYTLDWAQEVFRNLPGARGFVFHEYEPEMYWR